MHVMQKQVVAEILGIKPERVTVGVDTTMRRFTTASRDRARPMSPARPRHAPPRR